MTALNFKWQWIYNFQFRKFRKVNSIGFKNRFILSIRPFLPFMLIWYSWNDFNFDGKTRFTIVNYILVQFGLLLDHTFIQVSIEFFWQFLIHRCDNYPIYNNFSFDRTCFINELSWKPTWFYLIFCTVSNRIFDMSKFYWTRVFLVKEVIFRRKTEVFVPFFQ